jgi:hypothetical protein
MGSVWKINFLASVAGFLFWCVILLFSLLSLAYTARVCKEHREGPDTASPLQRQSPRQNLVSCLLLLIIYPAQEYAKREETQPTAACLTGSRVLMKLTF